MEKRRRPVDRQIHTVRTWLDKAEKSYASDASTKGQMQLLLAKAEMQHLDEQQTLMGVRRSSLWMGFFGTMAVLGVVGALYWQPLVESKPANITVSPIVQVPWETKETKDPSLATEKNWLQQSWPRQEFTSTDQKNFFERKPAQVEAKVEPEVVSTNGEATYRAPAETMAVKTVQPVVNQKEIQRAVQAWGKSLRGTE